MKHFVFFAFALLLASPAFAPDAAASHAHVEHRTSPTSYACIRNDSGWRIHMRVAYRRDNSNRWEHSPWSHVAPPGKRTCVSLGRAPEWREFHVYTKIPGVAWIKHGAFCYAAVRSTAKENTREYPAYVIGKFTSHFNWRKFKSIDKCRYTPTFHRQCHNCRKKDW